MECFGFLSMSAKNNNKENKNHGLLCILFLSLYVIAADRASIKMTLNRAGERNRVLTVSYIYLFSEVSE